MKTDPKTSQIENGYEDRSGTSAALVGGFGLFAVFVSIIGSIFGVAGALLLAMPALPAWGFGAFIVSNVAWLIASKLQRQWPLHFQQWIFLCCSLIGLWNWWLGPLILG